MIPSFVTFLDELPRTDNGKLDRSALPESADVRSDLHGPHVPPRTPLEMMLAQIWMDELAIDRVGIHDAFMALGGDSLFATLIVEQSACKHDPLALSKLLDEVEAVRDRSPTDRNSGSGV